MNGNILKLSLIIILIVIAFLGYKFFVAAPAEPAGLVGLAPAGVGASDTSTDEFLTLLLSLKSINLSDLPRVSALLSGLQDFSTTLQPQTPGRANPFSPIGEGSAPITVATSSTTATTTNY